jgi:uncharacterized protein (UPF0276 family)
MMSGATRIGLAMNDALPALLTAEPHLVDYVEVPFERLAHSPDVSGSLTVPVILHCASLSLAGNLPPAKAVIAQLRQAIAASGTPWLGEHLAFVSMAREAGPSLGHSAFAPPVDEAGVGEGGLYNVGYTVSPQYSIEILERVATALDRWERFLDCPLLIENGPVYFEVPGSTMSQVEFIVQLCQTRESTRLLLDLAHLACTAINTAEDAGELLEALPLKQVVEVHLSGTAGRENVEWDDHANPIGAEVFDLLDRLLRQAQPRAITLEYNWDPDFPVEIVRRDLDRVRRALA